MKKRKCDKVIKSMEIGFAFNCGLNKKKIQISLQKPETPFKLHARNSF